MKQEAILLLFGCSEVNGTWLITSELANQHAKSTIYLCGIYKWNLFSMFYQVQLSIENMYIYS